MKLQILTNKSCTPLYTYLLLFFFNLLVTQNLCIASEYFCGAYFVNLELDSTHWLALYVKIAESFEKALQFICESVQLQFRSYYIQYLIIIACMQNTINR